MLGPNIASTGRPSADARCTGPVSLLTSDARTGEEARRARTATARRRRAARRGRSGARRRATSAASPAAPVTTTRAPKRSRAWRPTAANAAGDQRRPGKLSPEPGCRTTTGRAHGPASAEETRDLRVARGVGGEPRPRRTARGGNPAASARSRNDRAACASRRKGTRTVSSPSRARAPLEKPTRCGTPGGAAQERADHGELLEVERHLGGPRHARPGARGHEVGDGRREPVGPDREHRGRRRPRRAARSPASVTTTTRAPAQRSRSAATTGRSRAQLPTPQNLRTSDGAHVLDRRGAGAAPARAPRRRRRRPARGRRRRHGRGPWRTRGSRRGPHRRAGPAGLRQHEVHLGVAVPEAGAARARRARSRR